MKMMPPAAARSAELKKLLAYWTPKRCKAWFVVPGNKKAQQRSWVKGELMIEHPEMTEKEAERLADRAVK